MTKIDPEDVNRNFPPHVIKPKKSRKIIPGEKCKRCTEVFISRNILDIFCVICRKYKRYR